MGSGQGGAVETIGGAEAPDGADVVAVAKSHAVSDEESSQCCVCGAAFDESHRSGTRYKEHCNQCSLDLRNIRKACGDDIVEGNDDDEKGTKVTIKAWMSGLQKNNLKEYREVFGRFKKQTLGVSGRGKKKVEITGGSILQFKQSDEHRQRTKQSANFEPMTMSRYCQYFTSEDGKMPNSYQLSVFTGKNTVNPN